MADKTALTAPPVFLSASVPERSLDHYLPDPPAIVDAIRALVAEVVRERLLVFGGHPAISPLVEYAARTLGAAGNVRIYQSEHFFHVIPPIARAFPNLVWTPDVANDRAMSLLEMRNTMIRSEKFGAAVFIGGMDGVEEEWKLFQMHHPRVPMLPVASTLGAAALLWQNWTPQPHWPLPADARDRLASDLDYRRLFRELLG